MSTMSPTLSATITETLPPRGHATIDSSNRGLVRKWLTSRGLIYADISGLTISQLSAAYNDTTDREFLALSAGGPVRNIAAQVMQPAPRAASPVAAPLAPVDQSAAVSAMSAALSAMMAAHTPQAAPIDEARILELIAEDTGAIPSDFPDWISIDWQATWDCNLRYDYWEARGASGNLYFYINN